MASSWSAEIRSVGLAASRTVVWRYRGQLRVTAVVKATFSFVPGEAMAIEEPDEILAEDVHVDGDPQKGLWAASDLAPFRLVADVVVVGRARVPPGGAARLAVFHDQALVDRTIAALAGGEAGFGPVAAPSPERGRVLGAALGRDLVEVPSDFDWAYLQAAPEGQTTDFLRGDEWIHLEGMTAEPPVLQTRLPGVAASGRVYGLVEGRPQILAFRADNLHVDAERGRCSVTWRASFSVADEARLAGLAILAGVEIERHPIRWPDAVPIAPRAPEPPPQEEDPEFGMATVALAPPEPAAPPPARGRQATVLLEPPPPPPPRGRQATVLLEPPPAPPPRARQATVLLEPPAAPSQQRQSTVLLDWGEQGAPPAPQRQPTVVLSWGDDPAFGVAMPDNHPLLGTMTLTEDEAAAPKSVGSPFRIAEPGATQPSSPADIPGAPWAAGASPVVPRPLGEEITRSLAAGALLPDDLVDDPSEDYLPTERIVVQRRAAPETPPADPDKGGAAERAWSWATVAEPPSAPPPAPRPPPQPVPSPAMKASLYGKFSPQKKR